MKKKPLVKRKRFADADYRAASILPQSAPSWMLQQPSSPLLVRINYFDEQEKP